jgi:hypothetical protein
MKKNYSNNNNNIHIKQLVVYKSDICIKTNNLLIFLSFLLVSINHEITCIILFFFFKIKKFFILIFTS